MTRFKGIETYDFVFPNLKIYIEPMTRFKGIETIPKGYEDINLHIQIEPMTRFKGIETILGSRIV